MAEPIRPRLIPTSFTAAVPPPESDIDTHPPELRDIISNIRTGNWSSTVFPRGFGALRSPGNETSFSGGRFNAIRHFTFQNIGGVIYYRDTRPSGRRNWVSTMGAGNEYFDYSGGRMVPRTGGTTTTTGGSGGTTPRVGPTGLPLVAGETLRSDGVVLIRNRAGDWRASPRHFQRTLTFSSGCASPRITTPGPDDSTPEVVFRVEPTFVPGTEANRGHERYIGPSIHILSCPGAGLTAEELRWPIDFQLNSHMGFPGNQTTNPATVIDPNNVTNFLTNRNVSSSIPSSALQHAGIDFEANFNAGEGGAGRGALRNISFSFRRPVAFSSGGTTYIVNNGTARNFTIRGRVVPVPAGPGIFTLGGDGITVTPYTPPE